MSISENDSCASRFWRTRRASRSPPITVHAHAYTLSSYPRTPHSRPTPYYHGADVDSNIYCDSDSNESSSSTYSLPLSTSTWSSASSLRTFRVPLIVRCPRGSLPACLERIALRCTTNRRRGVSRGSRGRDIYSLKENKKIKTGEGAVNIAFLFTHPLKKCLLQTADNRGFVVGRVGHAQRDCRNGAREDYRREHLLFLSRARA